MLFVFPFLAIVVAEANEAPQEEIVVTAIKLESEQRADLMAIGLSDVYLIHEYDESKEEWVFIRASNKNEKTDS